MKMANLPTRYVLGFAFVIFWLTGPVYGQMPEPARLAAERAAAAMRTGDFDAAIRHYTEAIDLFPKTDAFTPKSRVPDTAQGAFASDEYRGLDILYFGRFSAHLRKKDLTSAETDLQNSLVVVVGEVTRDLARARSRRSNVDLAAERKIDQPNSHNSELMRAASLFVNIDYRLSSIRARYSSDWRSEKTIPKELTSKEPFVKLLDEIRKAREAAQFGKAEAYVVSAVDVLDRSNNFWALKYANEVVVAYPGNIEAYGLRAKVHRFLGNEQPALEDERRIEQIKGQK